MIHAVVAIVSIIIFAVSAYIVSSSIGVLVVNEYDRPMKYVWECYDAWGDVWYCVATDPDDACREDRGLTSIKRREAVPYWGEWTRAQRLRYIERYEYKNG